MKKWIAIALTLALTATLFALPALAEAPCTETTALIDAGDHQIPATICMPAGEGKFPAVVMLHG